MTVAWNYIKNVTNTEPCGIKSILMLCVISYISFSLYTRNGDWFEITIWKIQIGKFICLLSKILHIIIHLFINSEWTRTLLYETFLETISFLRNPSSDRSRYATSLDVMAHRLGFKNTPYLFLDDTVTRGDPVIQWVSCVLIPHSYLYCIQGNIRPLLIFVPFALVVSGLI